MSDKKEVKPNLKNTLFVANLNRSIDEEQFRKHFEQYGNVVSVLIPKNEEGISKGYGYVEYGSEENVVAAKASNGVELSGFPEKVRCDVFMPRKERNSHRRKFYINVYIKNLDPIIDENMLGNIFQTCFGKVTKLKISSDENGSKGFGFLKFLKHECAKKLVDSSKKILFIKNLPETVNTESLKTDYEKFGNIEKTFVYRNCGIILFKNIDSTKLARNSLQGKNEIGKIITTSMFKKKGERKYAVNKINRDIKFNRFVKYFGRNYQIRGIDEKLTEKALYQKFKKKMVLDCKIKFIKEGGKNTGLGYVTFQSMDDAITVTELFHDNKKLMNGKPIIFITPIIKEVKSKKIDIDLHQLYDENYENYMIENGIPFDDQYGEQYDQFGGQYDQYGGQIDQYVQYDQTYGGQFGGQHDQFGGQFNIDFRGQYGNQDFRFNNNNNNNQKNQ